jgi:alkylation response protein AidB-like acyl-CoA dehydrogenase
VDLNFTEAEEAFRAEARAWLEANVPVGLPSGDTREGFALHVEWEKKLFESRWSVVSWPEEYGGRGASLWEWIIFEEEYYRAGGPQRVTQNGIFLLAPTIFEFGTEEQKARFLPAMAAADDLWCQGWSEPDAGSDLAGIKSRAARDDDRGGWVLNGQKTWTTRGAFCNWLFGLFRTDPEAARHSGMTYLMVPLDAEGVTVRGVERLDGDEGFAEVFFDDVFVPDDLVLGGVNEGWGVAMATTSSERGLTLRSPGRFCAAADRLVDLWKRRAGLAATGDLAAVGAGDPSLRDDVAQSWMEAEAYRLATLADVTGMVDGRSPGARSSLSKIYWSELDVRLHETALRLLGPTAELIDDAPGGVDGGAWMKGYEFALSGPIYAGTNEIQRNVVAERVLGLPRK